MKKRKNANLIMVLIIVAIVIAGVSAALMTRTSMGERLGILYVIRQKQYRLILPPVCDKMGKKRKRVEENAVRTNAGNAEKLLGHPENVY